MAKKGDKYVLIDVLDDHLDDIVDIDSYKNQILTVSDDRSALLYALQDDGSIQRNLSMIKHNTIINGAAFLNDSMVVTGDDEGIIKVWNTNHFNRLLKK